MVFLEHMLLAVTIISPATQVLVNCMTFSLSLSLSLSGFLVYDCMYYLIFFCRSYKSSKDKEETEESELYVDKELERKLWVLEGKDKRRGVTRVRNYWRKTGEMN